MKINKISIVSVISLLSTYCYSQNIVSSLVHENKGIESYHALISDKNGNSFTAGVFHDNLKINNTTYKSIGSNDIFIVKYNNTEKIEWIKSFGGTYNDHVSEMAIDSKNNVYLTGTFQDKLIIENDTLINSFNSVSAFLIKLNSSGKLLWSSSFNNKDINGLSTGNSLTVDSDDNIVLTGNFEGNISLNQENLSLDAKGGKNGFLVKFNSKGNIVWKKEIVCTRFATANKVKVSSKNELFLTGIFTENLTIAGNTLTSKGFTDVYLSKFSNDGELEWLKSAGSISHDYVNGLTVDKSGNAYICGNAENDILFDENKLHTEAESDIFIAKYSPIGAVIWAKSAFGKGSETATGLVEKNENIILIGDFNTDISWKNVQLKTLKPTGFIAHYDSSGNLVNAKKSALSKTANLSILENKDIIYVVGQNYNNSTSRTSNNFEVNLGLEKYNIILQKIDNQKENNGNTTLTLYPNPFIFKTNIKIEGTDIYSTKQLWVYDEAGKIIINGISFTGIEYEINISDSGLFLYRVYNSTNKLIGQGKFIAN